MTPRLLPKPEPVLRKLTPIQSAILDHRKLRDAALDEACKAEVLMRQGGSQQRLAGLWRTHIYLLWLAERHDMAVQETRV